MDASALLITQRIRDFLFVFYEIFLFGLELFFRLLLLASLRIKFYKSLFYDEL